MRPAAEVESIGQLQGMAREASLRLKSLSRALRHPITTRVLEWHGRGVAGVGGPCQVAAFGGPQMGHDQVKMRSVHGSPFW